MRRSIIAIIALFAAAPAVAQDTATTYRSEAGFAVDLPAGWVRAPASAVEGLSRAATSPGLTYEAVYQAGGARWPAPPFAAIARGVAPEWLTPEEFRRRWTATDAQAKLQAGAIRADTVRGSRVGARVGVPWWDEANQAAWLRADVEATGGFSWTVFRMHPAGGALVILVYYSAAGANEEQVLEELDSVVRSLRVN